MSTKPMFAKAQTIRALTKARKNVWLMFEDGRFTHTIHPDNVDNHTLVGTYSWRSPVASAVQINDDMHHILEEWRAGK